MQPLDTGNPGSYPAGVYNFQPVIGASGGKFVIFNTSPYFIAVNIQGVTFRVSPWFAREIECPPGVSQPVTITPIMSINLSAAPISDVYLEQYDPGEAIDEVYPQSVFGSLVSALAASQVINDGNAAVATVVEATPAGGPSSLKWNNDGSGYFGGGHDTVDNLGNVALGGLLSSLGGQASTGSFGAPVIVAQALNTHVVTTSDTSILSFTPGANGLYRVNIAAAMVGSGGATITAKAAYQDPNLGGAVNAFLLATDGVSTFVLSAAACTKGRVLQISSPTIYAASGTAIVVHWLDATASVSDFVSAFIERLS